MHFNTSSNQLYAHSLIHKSALQELNQLQTIDLVLACGELNQILLIDETLIHLVRVTCV